MILSDRGIKKCLSEGKIRIDPAPSDKQYATSSVDLLLGDELYYIAGPESPEGVDVIINPHQVDLTSLFTRFRSPLKKEPDGGHRIEPKQFALGLTRETIALPRKSKLAARVEGRSKLARLGLSVHFTAPTIHCGFEGRIVLEMYNFGPFVLKLQPGELAICQLIFERLETAPLAAASSHFQGQQTVAGGRIRPKRL